MTLPISSSKPGVEPQFTAELFDSDVMSWDHIGADIMRIEQEQFGAGAFEEEYLRGEFSAPETVAVLLREEKSGAIAGFTFAVPIDYVEAGRSPEWHETAYICDTALATAHQGQRLVGLMMDRLETELRRRGYHFLERDSAVENGYAEKIARAYTGRIVLKSEPHESEWGPQVFFRIRL